MKPIEMKDLKVGDLFTPQIQGKGRQSFTVTEVGIKQITCIETIDIDLVYNKKPQEVTKLINGYCYLLKRKEN